MIVQTISAEEDVQVVGETGDLSGMFELVRRVKADVVLMGCDEPDAEQAARRLAEEAPRARLLAITEDGLETFLFELCPRKVALGNLAPGGLLAVIRERACLPVHQPSKEHFLCR